MLKLWGRVNSINVQKVRWTLAELGIPHQRVDAGLQFGVVNEPAYRAMNPNGRVPTIDDEGFILWESNAIVRYLAAGHGEGSLWPRDARVRADSDRWMDWTSITLGGSLIPLFWALIRTPPEKRNREEIAVHHRQCIESLAVLDAALAGRDHVAGEQLTIGDIAAGASVHRWFGLPVERPPMPNLERYFARLSERPAYRETVMIPLT